jgi:ferredoxin/flavodoxin---NADP+ reductase
MMTDHRVAVIGAGPAGFYAAEHLLTSATPIVHVDMFDRLPTPWGLVRAGVAPDHPMIKSVSSQFVEIAAHPRYRFFGNIELGRDVSREDLLSRYDAVLYSIGARSERRLGIAGEDLPGSLAASDFVAWYNGHPDLAALAPDLSGTRAVVIGNGNVALDVARMLLLPQDVLRRTDTADHALAALAASSVRDVTILGRRGPAQAAFTTPELREIIGLEGLEVVVQADDLALPDDLEPAEKRRAQRNLAAFERAPVREAPSDGRRLTFRFSRSPIAIRGHGRVQEIEVGVNRLERHDDQVRSVDTGAREVIATDLVIRAIGYRGTAIPGVAFDDHSGVIPHVGGVVVSGDREYVAGWIKRGPSGVIGTNRGDAVETAERLLTDLAATGSSAASAEAVLGWLGGQRPNLVDQAGWMRIDRHETVMGVADERPRVKLVAMDDLLAAAKGDRAPAAVSRPLARARAQ